MKAYLEHANFTYADLDGALGFFQIALPEYKIRHEGSTNGRRWLHLGTEESYLALNQMVEPASMEDGYAKGGLNHLGFVVEDVDALGNRLLANGYKRSYPKQLDIYRIRDYFYDHEGNEYEFVQYLTDIPAQRNAYL